MAAHLTPERVDATEPAPTTSGVSTGAHAPQAGSGGGPLLLRESYASGLQDDMISRIGMTILSEMRSETSAGRMLVETASLMLVTWLVHSYAETDVAPPAPVSVPRLDDVRLRRVLDYITQHLHEKISVADLAEVACLSIFHFTRMFAASVGMPPSRYVSRLRLEHGKSLLAAGKLPLSEISLACCFSSQASFTRAFRRATGMTPAQYRRRSR